jgi:hypothetical protein
MMTLEFFKWWYGAGWALAWQRLRIKLAAIEAAFSVGTLLRTLFAPWRRIVSYPGAGLDAHLRAMIDNLVSRVVGFTVRIFVLIGAAVVTIIFGTLALIACLVWPILPLLAVSALIWGILG